MQGPGRSFVKARTAAVDVFSDVVSAFNEKQGVVPSDGQTPIAAASQQVQQDAHAFVEHVIDELHEEVRGLRERVVATGGAGGAENDEAGDAGEWLQVRYQFRL
jgi:urocanate hydratase